MTFLDKLANPPLSQPEAALTGAVALFTLSGAFGDLEKQLISTLRDEFPPLSKVNEAAYNQFIGRAVTVVNTPGTLTDIHQFVQQRLVLAIELPADRLALYRFIYALAMSNINIDSGEQSLLDAIKAEFVFSEANCKAVETAVTNTYAPLHRALAALALGWIVVAADGVVKPEELSSLKADRKLLDPIARMDDTQFLLIYEIGQSLYTRFLNEANNRRIFLYYIIVPRLDTIDLRTQAFRYAASVATSDGDIAKSEIDMFEGYSGRAPVKR